MKIKLFKEISAKNAIMGFKGFGYVGYITTMHIITELNAELIGVIDTIHIPPYILVKSGIIHHPYEIYQYRDILIPVFEDLSVSEETNLLLKKFIEWCINKGVERFVLVGGLDKSIRTPSDPPVKMIVNNAWIAKFGIPKHILNEEIRLLGPLAITFHYATLLKVPSIGVLAFAEAGIEDLKASAHAVEEICKLLNLKVSTRTLFEKAVSIEKITRVINQKDDRGTGLYA